MGRSRVAKLAEQDSHAVRAGARCWRVVSRPITGARCGRFATWIPVPVSVAAAAAFIAPPPVLATALAAALATGVAATVVAADRLHRLSHV